MRGFDTQGSIFIDGIRDLGTVTRDVFNTEQVEIAKGPAGPDNGRSAASGYVNLASKVPTAQSFTAGTASYGTANNARITGDVNYRLGESGTAFRVNVMGQDGDVDGRDFIERKGWAVAPSVAFGLEGDTRAYFYLLHTEQDNIPDGGVPTIGLDGFYNAAFDAGGAECRRRSRHPVERENYYGFASDFEEIKGTMFTARIEHDFSDNVTLRNTSRYGKLHQFYVLTGVNALTVTNPNPDLWTVARTRQSKFQDNTLLTNQTNITANLDTGGVQHAITGGIEFIDEEQYNPTYVGAWHADSGGESVQPEPQRRAAGLRPGAQRRVYARRDADRRRLRVRHGEFAEQWQVTAGFRVDASRRTSTAQCCRPPRPIRRFPSARSCRRRCRSTTPCSRTRSALVFKPVENGSIYLSHATSQQPPGGSNFSLSTAANNANNAESRPDRRARTSSSARSGNSAAARSP